MAEWQGLPFGLNGLSSFFERGVGGLVRDERSVIGASSFDRLRMRWRGEERSACRAKKKPAAAGPGGLFFVLQVSAGVTRFP